MTPTLIALGVLLLLPGLAVVRAPWPFVPSLSLAFWVVSISWPPLAAGSRGRALVAFLVVSAGLVVLRLLPKYQVPPPPGWTPRPDSVPPAAETAPGPGAPRLSEAPARAVLAVALALVGLAPLLRHAPGSDMAFQTTSARLVLWHDGLPLSAEPLLPLAPFGAHAPALATLAADVAAVPAGFGARAAGDPARAVLTVFLVGLGLQLLGLFVLEAVWLPPPAAALGALLGLAVTPFGWLALWGSGEAALCLGFALPAAALVLGRKSRSSAFAAGLLFGAALLSQPILALAVAAACVVTLLVRRRRRIVLRLGIAAATAVALAGSGFAPALRAVSLRELQQAFSPSARDLAAFVTGASILVLCALLARRLARPGRSRVALGACVIAGVALVGLTRLEVARGQLSTSCLAALAQVEATSEPLDVVCGPAVLRDWIPAIAGRAVGEPGPWIPAVYRDEWALRVRRHCRVTIAAP